MAPRPAPKSHSDDTTPQLRRILQLLGHSPCPCSHSTRLSWPPTNLPSNSRSLPRNRMAPLWARPGVQPWRNHHPDSDIPCHALYSTTPFLAPTSLPASSRIRPGSCRGLLGVAALSADRRYDDGRSTMSACPGPTRSTIPRRSCTGQQVRAALWVVREAESEAESRVELPAAWVAA